MFNFQILQEPSQILEFRDRDQEMRTRILPQSNGVVALNNMDLHYRYFTFELINAFKESFLNFSICPTWFKYDVLKQMITNEQSK
jgi:hypothetical protein